MTKRRGKDPYKSPWGFVWALHADDSHEFEGFYTRKSLVRRLAEVLTSADYEEDYDLLAGGKPIRGVRRRKLEEEAWRLVP